MNVRRRVPIIGALCLLLAALASCTSTATKGTVVSEADSYVAAIQWYIGTEPITVDTVNDPLVLYVAPSNGKAIDVEAQATVLSKLADVKDHLTIRFADGRDDAIDTKADGQPVKDSGVLLLVGRVTSGKPPVSVRLGVYRDAADSAFFEIKIGLKAGQVQVTSASQLEPS